MMTKQYQPFENLEVATVFSTYPAEIQKKLMGLRQLIFDTASTIAGVGELEETLKWGQPSYLTPHSKSGTTIRIDQIKGKEGQYGMFFHCQSRVISNLSQLYPHEFTYEGKRAIIFNDADELPIQALSHAISMALTYHRHKKDNAFS